jgi:hypothetical protein
VTLRKRVIADRLGLLMRNEIAKAAPEGPYRRLKKSFRTIPFGEAGVSVFSLYYWAIWVNDGRRAQVAKKQFLFYADPRDDPRIDDDYPQKPGDRRPLTKAEFRAGRRDKTIVWIRRGRSVAGVSPTRFIEKGVAAGKLKATVQMQRFLKEEVARSTRNISGVKKISVRFGR